VLPLERSAAVSLRSHVVSGHRPAGRAAKLDDILGQALSPADASSAKPAKPTDPAAVGTVLDGALGGLLGHGKR
jgi:hypothetical protein